MHEVPEHSDSTRGGTMEHSARQSGSTLRVAAILLLVGAIALSLFVLPIREYLARFLEWVRGIGLAGAAVLAAAYIPASILFFPGSILTLGAGFVFGVPVGTVAVSIGSTLGAAAAFLIGRTLAHQWIEAKVARNPRFRALGQAVEKQGFKIVLLSRLSPVFPFNLLNYAFGITTVSFRDYFLGSWIGMLPGTVMYVYLGSAAQSLAAAAAGKTEGGSGERWFFFLGLAATVVVTVFITRIARRALREAGDLPENGPETGGSDV